MIQKIGVFFIAIVFIVSCGTKSEMNDEDYAVKMKSDYLLKSELKARIPSVLRGDDSIAFAKNYINKWIKSNLMLDKAKINLSDEMSDIDKQVEDYRSSLLIYKYEQQLLKEKFDTVVTENEVRKYYDKFSGEFKLEFNIVKAIFIKIPRTVKDQYKIKNWYWSDKEELLKQLEDYCIDNADEFDIASEWVRFDELLSKIPTSIPNQEQFFKYNKIIDAQDSLNKYYVNIKDYKLVGDTTPIKFVNKKIQSIILNKRKIEMLKEIENSIYEKALSNNDFKIYE